MKQFLLLLAGLLMAGSARAQAPTAARTGPWAVVNTTNAVTPPAYAVGQLVTLSSTFAWGLAYDATAPANNRPWNTSVRATNAAGTEFDFRPVLGTTGGFQPANISVPAGVSVNLTAFVGQYYGSIGTTGGGSEVLRTTDGGASWQIITKGNLHFVAPDGFLNWAYAIDADHAVTMGDPNNPATQFEIWYTSNASAQPASAVVWTRASAPAALSADEYGVIGSYAAVGDTIWAGTSHAPNGVPAPARILRSTDRGHTWTAHSTPLVGQVEHLAFKDALHGVAFTSATATGSSAPQLVATANGGLTWTLAQLPNPATADTVQGKFYQNGIAAIPHIGYVSYGVAIAGNPNRSNRGASLSYDGRTFWTDLDNAHDLYTAAGFVQCGAGYRGYLGGQTTAQGAGSAVGTGGLYQANACVALAARPAARPQPFTVAPNPSADGRFQLHLTEPLAPGTRLTVTDALGRPVLTRALAPTATNTLPLDLGQQTPGVYILRLTSALGTATQKLVIQ